MLLYINITVQIHGGVKMLKQPTKKRNLTKLALEDEKKHIDMLNEALGVFAIEFLYQNTLKRY